MAASLLLRWSKVPYLRLGRIPNGIAADRCNAGRAEWLFPSDARVE